MTPARSPRTSRCTRASCWSCRRSASCPPNCRSPRRPTRACAPRPSASTAPSSCACWSCSARRSRACARVRTRARGWSWPWSRPRAPRSTPPHRRCSPGSSAGARARRLDRLGRGRRADGAGASIPRRRPPGVGATRSVARPLPDPRRSTLPRRRCARVCARSRTRRDPGIRAPAADVTSALGTASRQSPSPHLCRSPHQCPSPHRARVRARAGDPAVRSHRACAGARHRDRPRFPARACGRR